MSRRTLYTLCVDGYAPEITARTFPLMERWARKIRADFHVIETRQWPWMPPVYEKFQIHELAKARGDEWSLYLDADALVHPDTFDPTQHLPMDTVMHHGADMAGTRWTYDDAGYFQRDGRHIGACNWFAVASRWCRDLWHPLDEVHDLTYAEALEYIAPIQFELTCPAGIKAEHLIDDYVCSRNIARYGLKFTTFLNLLKRLQFEGTGGFWHQYTVTPHQKLHGFEKPDESKPGATRHEFGMLDVLKAWGVPRGNV